LDLIDQFVTARRDRWGRLEQLILLARGRQGSRLSAAELEELGRGYRLATSDLAIARRDFSRDRTTRYLEGLVGRAHPVVYRPEGGRWSSIWAFASGGFPRLFRGTWRYTFVAFLLFIVPFLLALLATLLDPTVGRMVMPDSEFVERVEAGETWLEIERSNRPLVASVIATNNIQVTFFAFAGGALFGVGTVWVLVNNGLSIGAVSGLAGLYGLGDDLSAFVSPHGGIELTVIFIAGGAGLRVGYAMLSPGLRTRRDAVVDGAHVAIRLMAGCVVLLLIAGTIEGFISPSGLPDAGKYAFGALMLVLLCGYLLGAGRVMGDEQ
jgi:uncharacterized membrane protein SpoIIM required for sporulation